MNRQWWSQTHKTPTANHNTNVHTSNVTSDGYKFQLPVTYQQQHNPSHPTPQDVVTCAGAVVTTYQSPSVWNLEMRQRLTAQIYCSKYLEKMKQPPVQLLNAAAGFDTANNLSQFERYLHTIQQYQIRALIQAQAPPVTTPSFAKNVSYNHQDLKITDHTAELSRDRNEKVKASGKKQRAKRKEKTEKRIAPEKFGKLVGNGLSTSLAGLCFYVCLHGNTLKRSELQQTLLDHGATLNKSVAMRTTHLLTSQKEFNARSLEVSKARRKGIPIVHESFIMECIQEGSHEDVIVEKHFIQDPADDEKLQRLERALIGLKRPRSVVIEPPLYEVASPPVKKARQQSEKILSSSTTPQRTVLLHCNMMKRKRANSSAT